MIGFARGAIVLGVGAALVALPARGDERGDLARHACAALDRAVAARPGDGPLLLASYPTIGPEHAALRDVAFTYDNALASIALFACGRPRSAHRIADALVRAATNDPEIRDGRIRNAYAAGDAASIRLAGHWDAARGAWSQDAYQVSSATGNAAWAALALLDAHRRGGPRSDLDAARRILDRIARDLSSVDEPAGFVGGFFVGPQGPVREGWKSTEHHVDLAAAWTALDRAAPDADARTRAAIATRFVNAQWEPHEGRFLIGTAPDGRTPDRHRSGLDAQVWPLIAIRDPLADWLRALAFVDAAHRVASGGYGFARGMPGMWTEGTAQVAAVFVLRGMPRRAQPLWTLLREQQADDGWLFATPEARLRTGLAIGPDSSTDDFAYYHLPHLGATAWAVLAAKGVNPFGGP